MADFDKQKKELTDQVLNEKRSLAYEASVRVSKSG